VGRWQAAVHRLTCPPPTRKGGASSARVASGRVFLYPLREADAFIVVNDPENAPIGPDSAGDPKLDSLEDRIAAARKAEDQRMAKEHAPMREGRGGAIQVASMMLGYPLGGIIIGFALDSLFDTLPWITIALMFLAFIGACIHVVRASNDRAK
jgi:ATP synthase protein I